MPDQIGGYGAALELARRLYGGDVVVSPRSASIGVTPTEALGGDPERVQVVLINLSPNDVYLGFDSQVSSTNGIWLGPNGGSVVLTAPEDGTMPTYSFWGIASAANSTLHIVVLRRETVTAT